MQNSSQVIFLIFLIIAAIYDGKERSIPLWLLGGTAGCAIMAEILTREKSIWDMGLGMAVGCLLLLLEKVFQGELGRGDGLFFCVSGFLLGGKRNLLLLGGGILVCGIYSTFLLLFGAIANISVRRWKLPFLPFLLPAGIAVLLL
ncbi:MAG: prepilin peptidase [bacterium]|nr:prepilin peptidase [bacterium]